MTTIFAVSSGRPPAAIAVLRISGDDAFAAARALAGSLPEPRRAGVRVLRDPIDGSLLDRALILSFPGPASATGEDVIELHLHGGRAVVAAVERVLAQLPMDIAPAEAGAFTRRALMNGRIDLTEAEGLGDLLAAETETQRRAAMLAAEGGIRNQIETWSTRLLALSAQVEAELDFSDEDDVPSLAIERIVAALVSLGREIVSVTARPTVDRLRDGVRVVLAGPPNSGKSTLLNVLVQREAAIVSPIAGTTRDRIEIPVNRDGIAYVFTDTAGLTDETVDLVERIGVDRARKAMSGADIIVWLGDDRPDDTALWLHTRSDAAGRQHMPPGPLIQISAANGHGIDLLWAELAKHAKALLPRQDEIALNSRQHALAHETASYLVSVRPTDDMLIIAEHARSAMSLLDRITGHSDTEAMLDALFGQFCIGK